jgi:C4-dicarboxylate-specific signal transduction histidine kinase
LPAILSKVVIVGDSIVHHGFYRNKSVSFEGINAYGWTLNQPADYIQRFSYDQTSISFHFSSPAIIDQKRQMFSFRLDGFEEHWSAWVTENKKEYTNLPSGSYVFRLKTMDALGFESEEVIYAFVIETPWYFKPWAWVIYFALFLSLVWVLIYITGRRLKYKNLVLQRLITERTREIMRQSEEIQEKNEELMQQKEEILAQSAELEKINRTLESRIQEAIHKSREKDMMLIQQSRLAAMGEMIGNIAHQWRQPLNAVGIIIQNINESYRCGELSPEYMTAKVDKSMDIIQYMSQTIDDFRNFFKPEKKMHLFDVKATVQRAVSFIEPTLINNNIELECQCEEHIQVLGYSNEYAQVVLNLLNNAKDAVIDSEVSNPKITISLKKQGEKSMLCIDDNGGGIASEYLEKIFTPYFSTKNPGKGTGIGLYMSKTIVEKNMQGSLTFKNTEEGARFTIVI